MHIYEIIFIILYFLGAIVLICTREVGDIILGILLILFSPCLIPFFLWILNGIISLF